MLCNAILCYAVLCCAMLCNDVTLCVSGGYMINWINGHSDMFKCLVNHDGIFNLRTLYYSTEVGTGTATGTVILWGNEPSVTG